VSRQAIGKWWEAGVPEERLVAVADLAAATEVLARKLKVDRIPAVVRRPFADAGGRSLLEVAQEDPSEVRALVDAMFDFSAIQR
jgi:hypothetical protein